MTKIRQARRRYFHAAGCSVTKTLSSSDPGIDFKPRPSSTVMARRCGPRPLALHTACAEWAWRTGNSRRLKAFYRGVEAYRRHPYRRKAIRHPVVWRENGCQVVDYGRDDGYPLLVVPSLINRAYILDLMPGASLLDYLADNGIRPFLLDWSDGTGMDRRMNLDGLILERMRPALDRIHQLSDKRPVVLGYCMGGTLTTALACLFQDMMAGLVLMATPWRFRTVGPSYTSARARHHAIASCMGGLGGAPIDLIQALFAQIDPMNVPLKFARFADMAAPSTAANRFVAIEDWLNDGVALDGEVAAECFLDWYGDDAPARGVWKVDGCAIKPERLDLPVCLAIPERDRIVPWKSSMALADIIPNCETIIPRAGHVGMVAGRHAKATLWAPLVQWIDSIAAMQKKSW